MSTEIYHDGRGKWRWQVPGWCPCWRPQSWCCHTCSSCTRVASVWLFCLSVCSLRWSSLTMCSLRSFSLRVCSYRISSLTILSLRMCSFKVCSFRVQFGNVFLPLLTWWGPLWWAVAEPGPSSRPAAAGGSGSGRRSPDKVSALAVIIGLRNQGSSKTCI